VFPIKTQGFSDICSSNQSNNPGFPGVLALESPLKSLKALIYRNYSAFVAYSSRAEGVDALPIAVWSPARFSVKMGSGPNQQPPMKLGLELG
jgi:hypothetical protein